ncbi:antibiotic biosynthesis monooxygenase [Streptomyces chrestomyceticus JCM 4735]|uniref:Antibiotic biosynthesis monooxygenase n=1 Tax=Streptomyces chrestomyceticus JCM 4735 TaxID=1306181 RepID=A0A7U9PYT6_9ACTN|nr:antibiotic biosynthesis monooxygenase family protein [Streptomyces chrestomyceticus]GCD37762.1 antibiotic biosynthesis monooxygenase [Streptomyces chrestomyceticus JCM 4735]
MIIVSGTLHVAPDAREAYLADCDAVTEQARKTPGCLDFTLTADRLGPGRINVYERWESDAELAAFRGSGPEAGQTAAILDADIRKYRISGVEAS